MSERIHKVTTYLIGLVMVTAVAAVPTVAQSTTDPGIAAVLDTAGLNADKVDGRHAIKYTTSKSKRKYKLVSTNANGMLPPNIVKPRWGTIQDMPAGFADGTDHIGFYTREFSCGFSLAAGATRNITISNLPGYLAYHFTAIPDQRDASMTIYEVHYGTTTVGDPEFLLKVKNSGIDSAGCDIRVIAFRLGLASAGPLSGVTVSRSKARQ